MTPAHLSLKVSQRTTRHPQIIQSRLSARHIRGVSSPTHPAAWWPRWWPSGLWAPPVRPLRTWRGPGTAGAAAAARTPEEAPGRTAAAAGWCSETHRTRRSDHRALGHGSQRGLRGRKSGHSCCFFFADVAVDRVGALAPTHTLQLRRSSRQRSVRKVTLNNSAAAQLTLTQHSNLLGDTYQQHTEAE